MDKNEIRIVIKYLHLKGLTATEIKRDLDSTLGGNAPSFSTVHKWQSEFRRGGMSTNDAPRSGRPKDVGSEENLEKLKKIALRNPEFTRRELAKAARISTGSYYRIVKGDSDLKQLIEKAKSVPHSKAQRKTSDE